MRIYERIASAVVGTRWQLPAERLRSLLELPRRLRHSELREVFLENDRIAQVIERVVKPGMSCIDVGAHLGSVLARIIRASPEGRHIAIEPVPYKADWLRRKFPGVDVRQVAVGETPGSVEFFLNAQTSAFSGLRRQGPGEATRLEVTCARLDDLVPRDFACGFLKVDVEGGELGAFRGARALLARSRPLILFECTKTGLEAFGLEALDVYRELRETAGYRVYLIKDWLNGGESLSGERFVGSMRYPFQAFNYVAAPD